MVNKTYKALAFDFDGTLFDTAGLNFKAYRLAYFDLGVEITEEMFVKTKGLSVYQFNAAMGVECDVERLRDLKAKYYAEMSLYAQPNKYLIDIIRNATIPVALVTTARMCNIMGLLEKYELAGAFSVLVTQENVRNYKPHPEAYFRAIQQLGVEPEEVLAFEDSRPGFVAAREAGCDCVKIREFRDDCIVDLTGGSESRTRLVYHKGQLIVRKDAEDVQPTMRLENQCEFLKANEHPALVPVLRNFKTLNCFYTYTMPYVFGPSFYEYQNKIGKFREVMERIYNFDMRDTVGSYTTHGDIRERCFEMYIRPGVEIYDGIAQEKSVVGEASEIPDFVNSFRVTRYHGDTTFENIIMSRTDGIILIDPVPDGNAVTGLVHDFAKLGQSLCGYEAIRDGVSFDYTAERQIFDEFAFQVLTEDEYKSLKFHVACLYFRRLKHQVKQNPALVRPYGRIALQLLTEFKKGYYAWA